MRIDESSGFEGFVRFVERLTHIDRSEIEGASGGEIRELRELALRYNGAAMPSEYEDFLRLMGRGCPVKTPWNDRPMHIDGVAAFYRYNPRAGRHYAVPMRGDQFLVGRPYGATSVGLQVLVSAGPGRGRVLWNTAWNEPDIAQDLLSLLYGMLLDHHCDLRRRVGYSVSHSLESAELGPYAEALGGLGFTAALHTPSSVFWSRDELLIQCVYDRSVGSWGVVLLGDSQGAVESAWRQVSAIELESVRAAQHPFNAVRRG